MLYMKTASIRDVQHDLGKVLAWVEGGEEVEVTRRRRAVARLIPVNAPHPAPVALPDFAARALAVWGPRRKGRGLSKTILEGREERP